MSYIPAIIDLMHLKTKDRKNYSIPNVADHPSNQKVKFTVVSPENNGKYTYAVMMLYPAIATQYASRGYTVFPANNDTPLQKSITLSTKKYGYRKAIKPRPDRTSQYKRRTIAKTITNQISKDIIPKSEFYPRRVIK